MYRAPVIVEQNKSEALAQDDRTVKAD